jgi:hypothetical protein
MERSVLFCRGLRLFGRRFEVGGGGGRRAVGA